MLSCTNLGCYRGERRIFADLGFCLPPGTLLTVRGPNGSGKSSLLRMLAGIIPPLEGQIQWKDHNIAEVGDYADHLIYIGHKNALKPMLSVRENLQHYARMHATELLIPAALHFFRLDRYAEMPVASLSAGWQRRVALARLLIAPTCKLWLLDEPGANLDEEGDQLLNGLIESRVLQDGIVVRASHGDKGTIALNMKDFAAHA